MRPGTRGASELSSMSSRGSAPRGWSQHLARPGMGLDLDPLPLGEPLRADSGGVTCPMAADFDRDPCRRDALDLDSRHPARRAFHGGVGPPGLDPADRSRPGRSRGATGRTASTGPASRPPRRRRKCASSTCLYFHRSSKVLRIRCIVHVAELVKEQLTARVDRDVVRDEVLLLLILNSTYCSYGDIGLQAVLELGWIAEYIQVTRSSSHTTTRLLRSFMSGQRQEMQRLPGWNERFMNM